MIYFLQCLNDIKIGFTKSDPSLRLSGCQTGSAEKITLIGVMSGSLSDERRLHSKFAEHRKSGEWFKSHDLLTEYIDNNAVRQATYDKVMRHVKLPEPIMPDMSIYMLKSDANDEFDSMGRGMQSLYQSAVNMTNELKARVASLEYALECAKPAVVFALENPDVMASNGIECQTIQPIDIT